MDNASETNSVAKLVPNVQELVELFALFHNKKNWSKLWKIILCNFVSFADFIKTAESWWRIKCKIETSFLS